MTGFIEKDGTLHADDIDLREIAAEHGTPSYVYSAGQIRENVKRLQDAFGKALPASAQPLIAYACKANSNLAILKLLGDMGLGADVVSGGELQRAKNADVTCSRIVFSGVGKTDEEICMALDNGILQINVESRPELQRIAAMSEHMQVEAPVALRYNPDVDAKTHAKITTGKSDNKFGMLADEIVSLYEYAHAHPWLNPYGLSIHIGSQLTTLEPYEAAFKKLAEMAQKLRSMNLSVESLDLGGGLGIVYENEDAPCLDKYAELVRDIIHPLETRIIVEPGRLLVGDAGLLLGKVLYVKETSTRKYVILDAGMNDLMRPSLYDAYHPIRLIEKRESPSISYDIVGPVCETGDTFTKDRHLPEVRQGDIIAIMASGAYGFVMASSYNTRPLPAEILVDGDKQAIIRHRQDFRDIIEKDHIPDWM